MAFELCPRCNLNYIKPGMKYCKVCLKDFDDIENDREICPMCGENPLEDGEDLCEACLESQIEMSGYTIEDDNVTDEQDSDDEEMEGMRLVDLENDAPDEIKDSFDTEEE